MFELMQEVRRLRTLAMQEPLAVDNSRCIIPAAQQLTQAVYKLQQATHAEYVAHTGPRPETNVMYRQSIWDGGLACWKTAIEKAMK